MEDLQIAYYLSVIMVGFAVLAMAGFWSVKAKDTDLRNFCILYALFTLVLILSVLRKYLSLNVEGYSAQAWYFILGIHQVLNLAVIVAVIHFFLGLYQIPHRTVISIAFLVIMFISVGLIYSRFGAAFDSENEMIHFGIGFTINSIWYTLSFTFALLLGYGFLRRVWNTEKRNFILGLLVFATFGYGESLIGFLGSLGRDAVVFGRDTDFLYSSIPYVLYGLFLIVYFLNYSLPTPVGLDQLSESFLSTYKITDREREIIEMVIQGKSNADIAKELVISLATVKTHLHNIYQKVGVDSRFDLLARVRSSQ
jgi:DNA-binding CsgD family transcriptional regulator